MAPGLVWRHRPCIAFVYPFSARLQQRLQPRQPRPTTTRTTTTTSSNHDSHDNNHNHRTTTTTTTTNNDHAASTTSAKTTTATPHACIMILPEGLTFLSSLSTYGSQIEINACTGDEGSLACCRFVRSIAISFLYTYIYIRNQYMLHEPKSGP